MSLVEAPHRQPPRRVSRFEKRRRTLGLGVSAREALAVWAVAFAAYTAVGYETTVRDHVVPFDGLARLAHAYFVWWNVPPKLAAVGFVWPPVSTLVYLPLTVVKPLATSLLAMPLACAAFTAATLVLLVRTFELVEMPRALRYVFAALYGVNPMIVYYATNGMSEAVYLFFLVLGILYFLRWYLTRESRFLTIAAVGFAFGVLSRYEVAAWAAALIAALTIVLIRRRVERTELEGTLIAYLAPLSYGVGLWLFVNWLILGDAFFFLRYPAPGAAAGTQGGGAAPGTLVYGAVDVVRAVVSENAHLLLLTPAVAVALLAVLVLRRDLVGGMIGALVALNAVITALLVYRTQEPGFLQLRYNMRAMPLAFVGLAWLYLVFRSRPARIALCTGAIALLVASLPVTWRTMEHYPHQFLEQAFTRALSTGRDQEGTAATGGYDVGVGPERRAADWIARHVRRRDSVLVDDAQSFPVMLFSGRPDLFVDRIDHGDVYWLGVRAAPWGVVRYVVVGRHSPNDLLIFRFPLLSLGREPGFTTVYENRRWVIARVSARRPPSGGIARNR